MNKKGLNTNLLVLIISILFSVSCKKENDSNIKLNCENEIDSKIQLNTDFAIYIVEDEIYGKDTVQIESLKLKDQPLITQDDIISYNWNNHELKYSKCVYILKLKKYFTKSEYSTFYR